MADLWKLAHHSFHPHKSQVHQNQTKSRSTILAYTSSPSCLSNRESVSRTKMCLGTHYFQQAPDRRAIEQSLLMNAAAIQPDVQQPEMEVDDHHSKKHHRPKSGHRSHAHIIVHHNYHDHSHDLNKIHSPEERHPARGGVTTPFPLKLHAMLDGVKREGREDVVSWQVRFAEKWLLCCAATV